MVHSSAHHRAVKEPGKNVLRTWNEIGFASYLARNRLYCILQLASSSAKSKLRYVCSRITRSRNSAYCVLVISGISQSLYVRDERSQQTKRLQLLGGAQREIRVDCLRLYPHHGYDACPTSLIHQQAPLFVHRRHFFFFSHF